MAAPEKKKRRSWTQEEENQLLQCYFSARNNVSLRTDKGIKSKAWTLIISRLARDGIAADKDQCRSKYSRIMAEYDAFKRICDLSGAGWSSATNSPTLDEEGWQALAQAQPRNAGLYKRFRAEGFAHTNMCALLAGDSRATAEDAETVAQFDASVLLLHVPDGTDPTDASDESVSCIAPSASDGTPSDQGGPNTPQAAPQEPPSAGKRTERVKRYRDGRMKSKDSAAKDEAKESVASFMRTAEAYFQMKMKMLMREMDAQEADEQVTHDV